MLPVIGMLADAVWQVGKRLQALGGDHDVGADPPVGAVARGGHRDRRIGGVEHGGMLRPPPRGRQRSHPPDHVLQIRASLHRAARLPSRPADAIQTIEAFSARLCQQLDLEALSAELLAVVDQTMAPTQAWLWQRPPPGTAGR